MNFLLVFLGGGFGCVVRYLIGFLFQKTDLSLPIATLFSNVTACIIFAIVLLLIQSKNQNEIYKLLLLTGFCGGLSTFSTFGYENYLLIKQSQYFWVCINIILSLSLCIGSFFMIKK